jgi:hypothetical protein
LDLLTASGRNNQYKNDQSDNTPISDDFHCTGFSLSCTFLRFQLREDGIEFSSLCSRRFVSVSLGTCRLLSRLLRILTGTLCARGMRSCFACVRRANKKH